MSLSVIENLRFISSGNRGDWLSAKIYSDSKVGCPCGGSFNAREIFKGLDYPVCDKCKQDPPLFRIRAKVVDANMQVRYIDLRHSQDGKRLADIVDCFTTLRQVANELKTQTFDVRRYDSVQSKESFIFKNYSLEYLAHQKNRFERKEISQSGYDNIKKYVKVLNTNPAYNLAEKDIASIGNPVIESFKNSFIDRFRTRDLALGELKAMLNHAHKMEMIHKVPKFDIVPASRKRPEFIPIDLAKEVASNIEDPQYRVMITLLTIYPLRPCELRALQWRDVRNGKIYIERHFSVNTETPGRKSLKGEKASLDFPIVPVLTEYMRSIPIPLNKSEYIFKGKQKPFVTENCMAKAWRKATRKMKIKDYQLYESRGSRLSEIAEQSNGDIVKMMKVSGHTNPKTLMERYIRSTSDLSEFFN